jgi:hypothetical protein
VTHYTVWEYDARDYKGGGTAPDIRKTVAYFCEWHAPQPARRIEDAGSRA